MNNLQEIFQSLSYALGWALLHSIWQGLLLYGLLVVLLKAIPRASSRFKYNLSMLTLAAICGWFVYTAAGYWQSQQHYTVIISTRATTVAYEQPMKATSTLIGAQVSRLFSPFYENYLPFVVIAYIIGVTALLFRLIYNVSGIRRLTTKNIIAPSEIWLDKLSELKQQLNISEKVRLLFSEKIMMPMVIGTIRPVILVPVAMLTRLDAQQLEAILVHELAHIRRYDYLFNIMQTIVETLLFFNPFVWAVSHIIRREREHCCDDVVIAHTAQPFSYAKALAAIETYRQNPLAMAATGNSNQLLNRIKRMMEMKKDTLSYSPLVALVVIALLATSLVWLAPALAQSKKDKKELAKKEAPANDIAPSDKETTEEKDDDKEPTTKFHSYSEVITIIDKDGKKRVYTSLEDVPQEDRKKLLLSDRKNRRLTYYGPQAKKFIMAGDSVQVVVVTDREINDYYKEGFSKSFDEAMADVDWEAVRVEVGRAAAEAEKGTKEAEKALADVDWNKISAEIEKAVSEATGASEEAKKALAEVDWNNVSAEVKNALAEAGIANDEVAKAMAEIDWDDISKQTQIAIIESGKSKAETEKAMAEARKAMAESRKAMAESRKAMAESNKAVRESVFLSNNSYEKMLSKMGKDGLIDLDRKYKVEKKNNALYINGKKQPASMYKKYSSYLGAESISIKGDKNSKNIKVQNGESSGEVNTWR